MLMSFPAVRHARVQPEQEQGQKLHNVVIGYKKSNKTQQTRLSIDRPSMVKKTWLVFLFRALPLMIPPLLTRALGLHPPILNWKHILIYPALIHRDPKQLASIPSARTELLARGIHRLPLALQLELSRAALLRLVQLPGAVDGPVPQVAGSRETEGSGGERVPEEVADQRDSFIAARGIFVAFQ